MSKRQIELAARLYELANTANLDIGGCDTDAESLVVERAIERCRAKLESMGYQWSVLNSLQACMAAASIKTPNQR